ncbi:SH3 domain-containing protein [Streptomyces sp. NPDC028722]|uniref:SH3 domain-containing protein n=1 Tax=Streptomyces sp. NPDC028722 TaxID=3155016 RepID=UPI0033DC1ED8
MRLRRSLTRCLAVAVTTGALAAGAAVAPAVAGDARGTDDPGSAAHDDASGPYQGVVTARGGLWLRDRPDRGSRRVRLVPEGETVSVFCKTGGEPVRGNPLWYLLTDGTWAWGSAAYIRNVGPAPRWC